MKKKLIVKITLVLVFLSCSNSNPDICLGNLSLIREQKCNIVVEDNINKSSRWGGGGYLKFKGININTREKVVYKAKAREWIPLSEYINIGDTVVKNEGEAVMRVYKKDSIVIRNLSNMCKKDFDWAKDVYTFILRDTIN